MVDLLSFCQFQGATVVTKPQWGLAACHHEKANSRGRGWWERKGVFIQMLNDQGGQGTPPLQAHLFHKTQAKPNYSQQDQNQRQCPEFPLQFEVLSFGALGS